MKRLVSASILIGITAMVSQIVLIRELLILFYGNELSIGIILANWLWWTTCGSWLAGYFSKKLKSPQYILAVLELFLAFVLIVTIIAIRAIKPWFGITPGEILGLFSIWFYSFLLLSGICILNGFLFVIACSAFETESLCREENNVSNKARLIGWVYVLEAIGAGVGGVICSFYFLKHLHSLQIIWIIAVLNLMVAAFILSRDKKRGLRLVVLLIIAFLLCAVTGAVGWLQEKTRDWDWPGYRVMASDDSIYGNITVTERDRQINFYENGLLAYSVPDLMNVEETVHLAMLQVENPQRVLLIGGGVGGAITEILKYSSLKTLTYIELDPLLIELSEELLSQQELLPLADPRVKVYLGDGRRFLKTTTDKYDVIIINLPDPYTAQINRFYTVEFFLEAAGHLTSGGVIGFGVTAAENYISPILGDFLRCIFYTLKDVFPHVNVLPGEYSYFIGGNQDAVLSDSAQILEKRLINAGVATRYIRDYYLTHRLSEDRKEYLRRQLQSKERIILNTDFHPISYFYDIVFWSTYFNSTFQKVFLFMAKMRLWHFSFPAIFMLVWFFIKKSRTAKNNYVLFPIMTSGFSEISFQVVTLVAFQVIYGYVYYKLGIILTSFMIGLALGACLINRILPKLKNEYSLFLGTQIVITVYPLLLPLVFYIFANSKAGAVSWLGENIVFPILPIIAGFVGGFQFPLGNRIYLRQERLIGKSAGVTYGIDLFGACVGSLIISAFILPILGITQICLIAALINFTALIVILKHQPASSLK